jgi:hypothetical protein
MYEKLSNFSELPACYISDMMKKGGFLLTGQPPVYAIQNLLAQIQSLLSGNCCLDLDHAMIGDSELSKGSEFTRNDIFMACKFAWMLEYQLSEQSKGQKILVNTFETCFMSSEEILAFRTECFKTNQLNGYFGPMSHILLQSHSGKGADDYILNILEHIRKNDHRSPDLRLATIISCKTQLSPAVTLREFSTLWSETWINSRIIEFGLHQHALCIGACCFKLQSPLPNGPKVYFANTWFFDLHVKQKNKWYLGTDWDWLIAPTFVDSNHFIVLAISFTSKKLFSYDSSSLPREIYLRMMKDWICSLGVIATAGNGWEVKEWICPQQNNGHDCGIFAFLASAYIPHCNGDGTKLLQFYSQTNIPAARKFLADSIYRNGETYRVIKWDLRFEEI